MSIKSGFLFAVFFSLATSVCQGQTAEEVAQGSRQRGLTVRLFLDKTIFSPGESIPINIQVSNFGNEPLLIGNFIYWAQGLNVSQVDFEFKDGHGQTLPPAVAKIGDFFTAQKEPNPATAFLKSYLLLYPKCSLTTKVVIGPSLFRGLTEPGAYSVSATYTSNGSYPPVYRQAGITDDDMKSVTFEVWSGRISTNEVHFRIRSKTEQNSKR